MSEQQTTADTLAQAAVAEIQSGMIVGLGTGRTASRAVLALAERVREEKLDIRCVPTSHATETLARAHQLKLLDFAMEEEVDYLFDIRNHANGYLALDTIVEGHAKVFVELATTDFHGSRTVVEQPFIGLLEPGYHPGDDVGVLV